MEAQKIINLLEESNDDDILIFQTRNWYIIIDQDNDIYGKEDVNDGTIKFNSEVIKLNFFDYSDA